MKRLLPLLVFLAVLGLAAPAWAHVTVSGDDAVRGGDDATITFHAPTEKDNASTTGLRIQLPTDTPLLGVSVAQMPGWTFVTKTAQLPKPVITDDGQITSAVSEIDWTAAAGSGIPPGGFGLFTIEAGQLPDTGSLTFKAIQQYSDGSTVDWIETTAPGSNAEPEHPAPVLTLSAPSSADPAPAATVAKSSSTALPLTLSIVALVIAAGALVLAVLSRRRA